VRLQLHPAQAAFLDSNALYRGFVGGVGSGKSFAGAWDLLRRVRPGRLYMVAAPTFAMLRDATLRSFRDIARATGRHLALNRSDMSAVLWNGAEVICRSADEPERWRGPNLTGIWLDEASLMEANAFDVAIGRLREAGERGWLSATFTPKGRLHWTYDVFGTGRPDTALFHARTADNPFLPEGFTDALARQYGPHAVAQELEGAFVEREGGLFKLADLQRFAYAPPAGPDVRRVRYWDKGYSSEGDYTAGALMARDGAGKYTVLDVTRDRWEVNERNRVIVATARADRAAWGEHGPGRVRTVIEQEPGAGKESTEYLLRLLAGYPCEAERVHGDKAERAEPFADQCAAGNVYWLQGPWYRAVAEELLAFPAGANDDAVDACAGAFNHLARVRRGAPAAGGTRPAFQAPLGGQVPGPYYGG
jgi:predicted phage terminase large subunit-like protein